VPARLQERQDSRRTRTTAERRNGVAAETRPAALAAGRWGSPLVVALAEVSTTPSATTTAAAAESAAAPALGAFLGLVHAKWTTVEHCAVHRRNGLGRFTGVSHRYETEATRLPAFSVCHDVYVRHVARRSERGAKCLGRGTEGSPRKVDCSWCLYLSLQRRLVSLWRAGERAEYLPSN
jgi:hypothetical protein